jgi:cytochrome oxidase assembly protein ShyY1
MTRKVPFLPTLVVLIAVGVMIRLGFWQVDRLHQKQEMLVQFAAAEADRTVHPLTPGAAPLPYSLVSADCAKVSAIAPQSGQNAARQAGWAQVASCELAGGRHVQVVLGWASQPAQVSWQGGTVRGIWLARGKDGGAIIANPPLAGLAANAVPDPANIPNNHLAYAVQWFAFAGVALVIYALALRKRARG